MLAIEVEHRNKQKMRRIGIRVSVLSQLEATLELKDLHKKGCTCTNLAQKWQLKEDNYSFTIEPKKHKKTIEKTFFSNTDYIYIYIYIYIYTPDAHYS